MVLALAGLAAFGGCAEQVDMGKAYDAQRAATTIDYQGVAEANRQFPDYGGIRAAILTEAAPAEGAPKAARGRKAP